MSTKEVKIIGVLNCGCFVLEDGKRLCCSTCEFKLQGFEPPAYETNAQIVDQGERLAFVAQQLQLARQRVSDMARHGRRLRMTIPASHDDDDLFICGALDLALEVVKSARRPGGLLDEAMWEQRPLPEHPDFRAPKWHGKSMADYWDAERGCVSDQAPECFAGLRCYLARKSLKRGFEQRTVTLDDGNHTVLCCVACDAVLGPKDEERGACHVCESRRAASQRCEVTTGMPCLVRIRVLAGLEAPCESCMPSRAKSRRVFGWEPVGDTGFYFSEKMTPAQQAEIRAEIAERVETEKQPTYTTEELSQWWPAKCPRCGWRGLSRDCISGGPIGDTGDYDEPECPVCAKEQERRAESDPDFMGGDLHVEDDEDYAVQPEADHIMFVDPARDELRFALEIAGQIVSKAPAQTFEDVREFQLSEGVSTVFVEESYRTAEVIQAAQAYGWKMVKGTLRGDVVRQVSPQGDWRVESMADNALSRRIVEGTRP